MFYIHVDKRKKKKYPEFEQTRKMICVQTRNEQSANPLSFDRKVKSTRRSQGETLQILFHSFISLARVSRAIYIPSETRAESLKDLI